MVGRAGPIQRVGAKPLWKVEMEEMSKGFCITVSRGHLRGPGFAGREKALLLFIVCFSFIINFFYNKHVLPCDYQHKNELVCFSKCEYNNLNEKKIRKRTLKQKERETGEERNKGCETTLTTKTVFGEGSKYIITSNF